MPLYQHLKSGLVIPAHLFALTAERKLDERRQRALTRYYIDAGAGAIAVGVHSTQFTIRQHGLYRPVLELAIESSRAWLASKPRTFANIAGIVGDTTQAVMEAGIARDLGYDAGLLSLGALGTATDDELTAHCREVASIIPVFGFYLQTAVGGRFLGYDFWRAFAEIENVCAVKIAPFNRYQTLDVVRAIADTGRDDIALYTGNDDNIVNDLVTPFPVKARGQKRERYIDGGLLGQWAVWTRRAVELLEHVKSARALKSIDVALLREGSALTDANAAIFDAANQCCAAPPPQGAGCAVFKIKLKGC